MSSQDLSVLEAKPLLTGLVIGESPRWHEGRLWFANWGTEEIVAVDLEGNARSLAGPARARVVDRLAARRSPARDGRGLMRREPDGSMVPHADLSGLGVDGFNEIVVDGRGNIYVNGGCRLRARRGQRPRDHRSGHPGRLGSPGGRRHRVSQRHGRDARQLDADRRRVLCARLTAFDIADDGGLSNRRVWADGVGPDGICMDADGAIWTDVGEFGDNLVGRVREGGEVLERVQLDRPCFACMLGGEDRETLFMLAADWRMSDSFTDNIARLTEGPRTGRLLTAPAPAPGRRLALSRQAIWRAATHHRADRR